MATHGYFKAALSQFTVTAITQPFVEEGALNLILNQTYQTVYPYALAVQEWFYMRRFTIPNGTGAIALPADFFQGKAITCPSAVPNGMIRIGTLREAISAPNNANITPTPSNPMAYFFNNQLIITPGVDDAKLFYLKSFPKIADDATEITKLGQANAAYIPELFEEFIFAQAIVYAGQRYFQRDDLSQADREKSAEVFDSLYAKLEMEKKPFEEYLNKAPK